MLRALLYSLFNLLGGGRGLFIPNGTYDPQKPHEVLVLAPGEIPTIDLYLRGRLKTRFGVSVSYVDTLLTSPQQITLGDNSMIVIVRHAPTGWLSWLEDQRNRLTGVVFLMDDDIPAVATASELPFRYALKTAWRYARTRRLLGRLCSEVWVSTPELVRRYVGSSPRLWKPGYVCQSSPSFPRSSVGTTVATVYFYHGSWAHRREIEWLVPIVRRVQETVPHAWFEIMGTDQVKRLFRGVPRVRIVHPMPWKDYLAYAGTVRYHIGLAPCFDTDFNRARSHSKVFDITRLGAAGIYSNVIPYAEKVVHGETGILCANDPNSWVAALTLLLSDQDLRSSLYLGARDWCDNSRFSHSI